MKLLTLTLSILWQMFIALCRTRIPFIIVAMFMAMLFCMGHAFGILYEKQKVEKPLTLDQQIDALPGSLYKFNLIVCRSTHLQDEDSVLTGAMVPFLLGDSITNVEATSIGTNQPDTGIRIDNGPFVTNP